jgi:hypothetical protein
VQANGLPAGTLELGRSMLRFSWAMAAFGAQQAVNLFSSQVAPPEAKPAAAGAFDAASHALEGQLGGVCRGVYEAGKQWFPGLVRKQSDVSGTQG